MSESIVKSFITSEHPVYQKRKDQWEKDERRYRGGRHVHKDLFPFQWEQAGQNGQRSVTSGDEYEMMIANLLGLTGDGEHYSRRKEMIRYLNFGKRMATKLVGRLSSEAPEPGQGYDFGALGTVRGPEEITGELSRAEMLWHDCDRQGSPFVAWWNEQQRWAMVTGHRWVGVAAPPEVARRRDEEQGLGIRPYLVGYSPLAVPNWVSGGGLLQAMVIKLSTRRIAKDGQYAGSDLDQEYLLYVRQGFAELGEEYQAGGWWKFKSDGEPLLLGGEHAHGDLSKTKGAIPYTVLYQEQDEDDMSRSAVETLGNMSVAYMNAASAQLNDVIEGGGRALYLLGVSKKANNIAAETTKQGARHRPVPKDDGSTQNPEIYDTGSVSASGPIKEVLSQIREEAAHVAMDETKRSPDASGIARQIEFMEVETPILSLMAFNRESPENQCLAWLCQLFGVEPSARGYWNKRIDLQMDAEDWLEIFDAAAKADARSATLTVEGLKAIARDKGLVIEDAKWNQIAQEIKAERDQEAQASAVDDVTVFD